MSQVDLILKVLASTAAYNARSQLQDSCRPIPVAPVSISSTLSITCHSRKQARVVLHDQTSGQGANHEVHGMSNNDVFTQDTRIETPAPTDGADSVDNHAYTEASQCMRDGGATSDTAGGDAKINSLFGTCTFEDNYSPSENTNSNLPESKTPIADLEIVDPETSAVDVAILTPLTDRSGSTTGSDQTTFALASKPHDKAPDAAKEFEARGREQLANAHKGLKFTTDGSQPAVVDYQDKYQVTEQITALDLAKQKLGPKASAEQLKAYAELVCTTNERTFDDNTFKAGTTIRLPGQTADGGIVHKRNGVTSTSWSDGSSIDLSESGHGSITTRTAAGHPVETSWDPKNIDNNFVSSIGDGSRETKIDAYGNRTEKVWVDSADNGQGDFLTEKASFKDDKGRTFDVSFKPGNDQPQRVVMTNQDGSVLEFKPNAKGEFLTADGSKGLGQGYRLFERSVADGVETRTLVDSGNWEKLDARGRVLASGGTDDWGRKAEYEFKAGEKTANKIRIEHTDGNTYELKRQKNGDYLGDHLDANGTKIGTVSLGNDSRLVFKNDADKSIHTQLKDGTTLEIKTNPDKTSSMTYTNGKEGFVVEYDNKGKKATETYTSSDGRVFSKHFSQQGTQLDTVKLEGTDGSLTVLNYDKRAQISRGHRVDSTGNVVETVSLQEDKLVFVDTKTGAVRAEKFVKPEGNMSIPKFVPGEYDRNTGKFTYKNSDGATAIESFAPGRTDTVKPDGSIEGKTISGDTSTLKPNGEATVLHADGSGVRLNANGTIDRWGQSGSDSAYGEKLSTEEAKFLKNHGDIDRRNLAEIHRKMGGDTQKLDQFYKELSTIDSVDNLTAAEKSALRNNILHHVANPGEIYQGRSPSCNVTVVQRDVAMTDPNLYVKQIVQSVSEGTITTADGTKVPLDPNNLKSHDSSGRDLASRIYQTAALAAEFHPHAVFRNSEDGVGRLSAHPYNAADKSVPFEGLNIAQIADTRYKLTGEEKAVAMVDNVEELRAAYATNGGEPMIVAVDGDNAPFEKNGPVGNGDGANHVVTLVGLTEGRGAKAMVHNQWGLESDHSSYETAIDASKLLQNMKSQIKIGGKSYTTPAMVLVDGDHTKAYEIVRGKLVMSPQLSATIQKGVRMVPTLK